MSQTADPGTPLETTPTAAAADETGPWRRWRPFLMRLHFYAGMFAGPFLLIAAVTGLLYALTPQLDPIVYRDELKVAQVKDERLPMSQQVAAAIAAHPEGRVTAIRPPSAADETTQVVMAAPDVPTDYSRTVFVDPYTAKVRGALTTYGQWLPIRAWFDEFHRNLHLGAFGRNYSELAASWMWIVSLGGLALWVGYRVRRREARRIALPDNNTTGRRRLMTWHGAVGVWIIVGLLGLSITGLTWSRYAGESIAELRTSLNWTTPSVNTALDKAQAGPESSGHQHGGDHAEPELSQSDSLIGIDRVLTVAQDAGLQSPMYLNPPTSAGQAWRVDENKRRLPTRYDSISVDPATGDITDRVNFSSWPLMAKMTNWTIDTHMGILFGLANQIVLALLMIGLIASIVLGYRMWWRRRPTRSRKLPRAPRRGALFELRPIEAVLVVVAIIGIGWYVPLFGWSLAAFVAVDVIVGLWQRTRSRTGKPESESVPTG